MVSLSCHPGDSWMAAIVSMEATGNNTQYQQLPDSDAIGLESLP